MNKKTLGLVPRIILLGGLLAGGCSGLQAKVTETFTPRATVTEEQIEPTPTEEPSLDCEIDKFNDDEYIINNILDYCEPTESWDVSTVLGSDDQGYATHDEYELITDSFSLRIELRYGESPFYEKMPGISTCISTLVMHGEEGDSTYVDYYGCDNVLDRASLKPGSSDSLFSILKPEGKEILQARYKEALKQVRDYILKQ